MISVTLICMCTVLRFCCLVSTVAVHPVGPQKVEIRIPESAPRKWKSGIRAEIRGTKSGNPESGQKSGAQKVEIRNPETMPGEDADASTEVRTKLLDRHTKQKTN